MKKIDMEVKITTSPDFDKSYKHLKKRYRSLPSDLKDIYFELKKNPDLGKDLGKGVHKIRVAIKSKGKGKRGGARVISHNRPYYNLKFNIARVHVYARTCDLTLKL